MPGDVEAMMRRLRMPHIRAHAPNVVATAKAQRWDPIEVLRVLLGEEVARAEALRPGDPARRGGAPDR